MEKASKGLSMAELEQSLSEIKQGVPPKALGVNSNIGETTQDHLLPPELSSRVQKLIKRPHFDGTYSRVFFGDYNGQKVSMLVRSLLQV
jgi:hypothetical protein